MKGTNDLLEFWEEQVRHSHSSSNYFFRKSPSHYHMMLLVMNSYKQGEKLSVEELKTKLFKTSRPKSALIINEACENNFFYLEKTSSARPLGPRWVSSLPERFSSSFLWGCLSGDWSGLSQMSRIPLVPTWSWRMPTFSRSRCRRASWSGEATTCLSP